ncbi:MAG: hypothetical protein AABY22_23890 [Nanoarchaeota archaeon]
MKKIIVGAVLIGFLLIGGNALAGCGFLGLGNCQNEKGTTVPKIENSIERANIAKKLQIANDPNTIKWIYLFSETGQVIFFSPVVGKVTSGTKRLEPIESQAGNSGNGGYVKSYCDSEGNCGDTNEFMQADGTYGQSTGYVFWYDPEGNEYQWNGTYFISTIPLKISTPIFNFRDVDKETLTKQKQAEDLLRKGHKIDNNFNQK